MSCQRALTMSTKELNRLEIIGRVIERRLTQWKAAEQLDLSLRQVQSSRDAEVEASIVEPVGASPVARRPPVQSKTVEPSGSNAG